MRDVFEPHNEPARSIFLALRSESERRRGRTVEEWIAAERHAVFREACAQAEANGLRAPSMEEVERAERYAVGSADYGAKWSRCVAEFMKRGS